MLAQSFMKAEELKITDQQQVALVKVLGMLERGEIEFYSLTNNNCFDLPTDFSPVKFNMRSTYAHSEECGTVGCLAAWAEYIGKMSPRSFYPIGCNNSALHDLFDPPFFDIENIQPAQAALALRNYLTTGDAKWEEVIPGKPLLPASSYYIIEDNMYVRIRIHSELPTE